jgi:hypothetical protein
VYLRGGGVIVEVYQSRGLWWYQTFMMYGFISMMRSLVICYPTRLLTVGLLFSYCGGGAPDGEPEIANARELSLSTGAF